MMEISEGKQLDIEMCTLGWIIAYAAFAGIKYWNMIYKYQINCYDILLYKSLIIWSLY